MNRDVDPLNGDAGQFLGPLPHPVAHPLGDLLDGRGPTGSDVDTDPRVPRSKIDPDRRIVGADHGEAGVPDHRTANLEGAPPDDLLDDPIVHV